ncbi:MAG: acetolactate synthase large subunit [Acidobacteria bacterium]|nr:acetolactate synthase large subunit [Acidobacteriota bacterium]
MTGAECLLRTLLEGGIDLCLMNPGTSEMQFVSALDRVPAMRGVLCLQETVCAGAADGYARMSGRPAATLLHLGPGLANALSNFHNARKARSPIVNIVGEHSTAHLRYDAPLTADVEAFARPVSGWVKTLSSPLEMGEAARQAIAESLRPPGQVSSLVIPADHSWSESGAVGAAPELSVRRLPAQARIEPVWQTIAGAGPAAIFLGGSATGAAGLRAAGATGLPVFLNRYAARVSRGRPWAFARRLAYFPEHAETMLAGLRHLILVEADAPVSFFGYPERRSTVAPEDCHTPLLAAQDEDGVAALMALGGGAPLPPEPEPLNLPGDGPLTVESLGVVLACLLPEGALVSDEMVSSGEPVNTALNHAAPHELLPVTGGSIGQGLPVAVGAALACPDRKVVALEADGSGMYSLQALWTMARENLNVVTIVFANRRYRILDVEMQRTGAGPVGPRATEMIDIGRPALDWVKLAQGMGVEASRATTVREFTTQFESALLACSPRLIEAVL